MNNQHLKRIKYWLLSLSVMSMTIISSCGDDDTAGPTIANEIGLNGSATQTVVEGSLTDDITIAYRFAVAAREAGSITINAVTDNLTYGTNYTTNPAETGGSITIDFDAGDQVISFSIAVIDDMVNLPDGSVTFTLASVNGEEAEVSATAASFTLTIQDNEGESITLVSDEAVALGEVIPGSNSSAKEITFTTLNVLSEITATASDGFEVAATVDGTYGTTASLEASATSVFVRASPASGTSFGQSTGTVTLSVADVSATANINAVISASVGELFWIENFDYPIDDTYPAYLDTYPASYANDNSGQQNWGIVPISALYRATANYSGADGSLPAIKGLERPDVLDTWYGANRLRSVAMGDGPLSITGYPGSGVGRTARLALDYSNQSQKANCNNEGAFLSKNTFIARRFVNNGDEITSGNVYFSAMIKVNELFDESTPVLKNAIMMLTGDATFVGANAMKLNIRNDGMGGFNFGVSKSGDDGSVVYGSTSYSVGETYAVIFKVEINEDAEGEDPNDVVSVYVFQEGDDIPVFESDAVTAEATIDQTNQDLSDVHDVTSGLEIFYTREVADVFGAGGIDNVAVHDVEFSGLRIGTSWGALFKSESEALYDSNSDDPLQTRMYGQPDCDNGPPQKLGNTDQ